jgi:hypothetical protein
MIHVKIDTSYLQSPYGFTDWGKVAGVLDELVKDIQIRMVDIKGYEKLPSFTLYGPRSENPSEGLTEVGRCSTISFFTTAEEQSSIDRKDEDRFSLNFSPTTASNELSEAALNEILWVLKSVSKMATQGELASYRDDTQPMVIRNEAGNEVGLISAPRADHLKYLHAQQQTSSFAMGYDLNADNSDLSATAAPQP